MGNHFGPISGAFWRVGSTHLGVILGSFWGSGRLWSASWLLGALGPPPGWLRGASGTLLGSLLGPKMAPSWSQVDLKIGPRGFQDGSQNETSVGRPLECENGAQMGAGNAKMKRKWEPNGPKIQPSWEPKGMKNRYGNYCGKTN